MDSGLDVPLDVVSCGVSEEDMTGSRAEGAILIYKLEKIGYVRTFEVVLQKLSGARRVFPTRLRDWV